MGGLSLPHLIILALVAAIFLYPMSRILRRAGYSGWLALFAMIPFVGIVGIWWFAFARWPSLSNDSSAFR